MNSILNKIELMTERLYSLYFETRDEAENCCDYFRDKDYVYEIISAGLYMQQLGKFVVEVWVTQQEFEQVRKTLDNLGIKIQYLSSPEDSSSSDVEDDVEEEFPVFLGREGVEEWTDSSDDEYL